MDPSIYPLLLTPKPSRRLWGGSRLAELLDVATSEGEDPVGEAWLMYAENEIANGAHAGRTLQEVATELGGALLGTTAVARYGTQVPLLLKLLDAARPLSVQVHPDDAFARREEAESGHLGKEEAWYIMDADPNAQILWGLAEPEDEDTVRAAVRDETLEDLVAAVDVTPGDVIYNPAGTVHAVGAGIFLFEVQQSSDLTYRLYDYGRRDARGELRELHLDKALEVADLSGIGTAKVEPRWRADGWTELIRTPYFVMDRFEVEGEVSGETSSESMETLTFVRGEGSVHAVQGGQDVAFAHQTVVLPAGLGAWRVEGRGELIRCRLPGANEIRESKHLPREPS